MNQSKPLAEKHQRVARLLLGVIIGALVALPIARSTDDSELWTQVIVVAQSTAILGLLLVYVHARVLRPVYVLALVAAVALGALVSKYVGHA